jgi:hypothetical protein
MPWNFVSEHGFTHLQSKIRTQKSNRIAQDATQGRGLRCRLLDTWIFVYSRLWFLEASLHLSGGAARTKVLDQITLHPCF